MKKTFAILLLAVLFVGSALQAQDTAKPALRTWKDSTGQFSIDAVFVRVNGDQVVLQGTDKKEISLPLAKISAADQQYVKARLTSDSSASKTITNMIGMKFNKIPAGTFMMGSPENHTDRRKDQNPQHNVAITKGFYLQTTEVTQRQWKAVMGTEPWNIERVVGGVVVKEGLNYPAQSVSWDDAVAYCKKLSAKEGKTYRLPTEAEWEYACRAGTKTTWSFGNDEKVVGDYAWYKVNSLDIDELYPHKVGLKKPNAFGLYDMHGNVYEWCHDYYGRDYYKQSPEKDPTGPAPFPLRVLRGGSWRSFSQDTRSAYRARDFPDKPAFVDTGFRLVRELD
jgi:formylglycine-generating enzyme required for sulfatase activity